MKKSKAVFKFEFNNRIVFEFFCECLEYSMHCIYRFYSDFHSSAGMRGWQIKKHAINENIDKHVDLFISSNGEILSTRDATAISYRGKGCDALPADCLASYSLKNFRGGVTTLFSCQYQNSAIVKIFDESQSKLHSKIGLSDFETQETTLQVTIHVDGKFYRRPLSIADIHSMRAAQLIGINVPLILVQDLLKRDIKTKTMVDDENLDFAKRTILLTSKKIVFDLDETIIWNGKLVPETMKILRKAKKQGVDVALVTRHKGDIGKTLQNVGLKWQHFDEIIQVDGRKKKSSFIKAPVVFIDNEFPERFDVRENTGSLVLNLDVLKYCSFGSD